MMKRELAIPMVLILVLAAGARFAVEAAGQTAAWNKLFDGTSLAAFNRVGNANWQMKDGAVEADSGTGFLVTKESYADFQMKVEFWVDDAANSGVFIRCQNPNEITAANAYEVNIFDKRPDQSYRTGGIVDVAKPLSVINTGGKWNTFEISAQGPRLIVTLNGEKMVDMEHKGHTRGPIALQYGAGIVKFRNVEIRRL